MLEGPYKVVHQEGDESYHYWEMFDHTYAIQYGEGLYCYLLEGDEKALLIDTGYGRGDFPNVIARLTDLPILVANTHGHYDHTGGNAWFPKAYMHPLSEPQARKSFRPLDPEFWANMPYPKYEIECIEDGYVFDLGNRKVECIHTPAHHPGSLTFLDHGQRLLFSGDEFDSAQAWMLPGEKAIPAFLENMKKLKARSDEYDFILPQHNGGPITKLIENAEDILAGNPHLCGRNDAPGAGYGPETVRSRVWHASITYRPEEK